MASGNAQTGSIALLARKGDGELASSRAAAARLTVCSRSALGWLASKVSFGPPGLGHPTPLLPLVGQPRAGFLYTETKCWDALQSESRSESRSLRKDELKSGVEAEVGLSAGERTGICSAERSWVAMVLALLAHSFFVRVGDFKLISTSERI